mgnify:CR=1 FL=1
MLLARGVPVVYHNPHGEKVPDFQDPRDAFLKTTHSSRLIDEKTQLTYTAAWLKVTGS